MLKTRYTATAIAMHWLSALLIVAAFALGVVMVDMKISPAKLQYFSWHKWLGITVLASVALRLLWRLSHRPPALQAGIPHWQRLAAAAGHWTLYVLMFAIPLSGWAYSSASGYPVVYLGQFQLPDWVPRDKALASQLKEVHELLTTILMVLVAIHVAAALKHQFVDKDGLIARMWFGRKAV